MPYPANENFFHPIILFFDGRSGKKIKCFCWHRPLVAIYQIRNYPECNTMLNYIIKRSSVVDFNAHHSIQLHCKAESIFDRLFVQKTCTRFE